MKKNINYIFKAVQILTFCSVMLIVFIIIQELYYERKFESTKLNIPIEKLKEEWGEPDDEFITKSINDSRVINIELF